MIFVDSSVWIDLFKDIQSPQTDKLLSTTARDIIVGDLVLYEILRGARDDLHARKLQGKLGTFQFRSVVQPDMAIKAAAGYRKLRAFGITIRKDVDMLIGTWCIENSIPLLHNDRDFLPMVEHLGLKEF
jgi:predicted nucleic acid-binding protein